MPNTGVNASNTVSDPRQGPPQQQAGAGCTMPSSAPSQPAVSGPYQKPTGKQPYGVTPPSPEIPPY